MTAILIAILNMSISGSIVAVAVMVVYFPLKKAPKIFSYALWIIVFLRFICPFNFESPASLMPTNAEIIPPIIATATMPKINSGISAVDNSVNIFIENTLPLTNSAASINPIQSALSVSVYIWLLGMLVLLIYAVVGYIRVKHQVYDATLMRNNYFVTDKIHTAFVLGLICPKIYVPTSIIGAQLDYILKHEQVHIRRKDYLIKPFAFLVLAVHWFNPVVWISYYFMSKDMEMSCDEAVLCKSSEDIRQAYSTSLLSLYTRKPGLLSPLAFGEGSFRNMKARIKNVLDFKQTPRWTIILCSFLLVLFMVGFTTNPPKDLVINNLEEISPTINHDTNVSEQQPSNTNSSLPTAMANTRVTIVYEDNNTSASKPTGQELSMGEAADIGVRQLVAVFGLNLNEATISMQYIPGESDLNSNWRGFWYYESSKPNPNYSFRVNSLTGSVDHVVLSRTLELQEIADKDGYMIDLYKENPKDFEAYALQIAQELDVVDAAIKTFRLYSQNVTTEHNVTFEATGANGQQGWLVFSRHDKALLAVVYHSGISELEKHWN